MFERMLPAIALLALALTSPAAGPALAPAWPAVDLGDGLRWQPHPRALAAGLFVAGPGTDPRLLREALGSMRDAGMSVFWLDPPLAPDATGDAIARTLRAWAELRRRHPGLPWAMAGHGAGATLAAQAADTVEPSTRPQLLWMMAPRAGHEATDPAALPRAEAAIARVDALCNGRVDRVTRIVVMQGVDDGQVDAQQARALAVAAPAATLYRVPRAGHHDLLAQPETRMRLQRQLLQWIHQARSARTGWRAARPALAEASAPSAGAIEIAQAAGQAARGPLQRAPAP